MFVGRDEEISDLRAAIKAAAPRIAVIYGRRRIGKTALIREAVGKIPALFIEGLENQGTQAQIASFLAQASRQLKRTLPAVTSWQEALMALDKAMAGRRMVIVLDEFQWLANYRQELVATLKQLLVVVENYPQLKADQNFLSLQTELINTENRIQAARRFYNGNIRDFRNKCESFPSNLVARGFGFQPQDYFTVPPAIKEVPDVQF